MAGPPVKCLNSNCQHVFEMASLFGGTGTATNIMIIGNMTNCPRCGSEAAIGDGVYEYSDGQLRLTNGPPLTKDMIGKLTEIAQSAKTKPIETEELLAEVADVNPELAHKLRERGLGYFAIILLLIWLLKSVSLNITVDLNELIDQAQGTASEGDNPSVLSAPLPHPEAGPNERPHSIAAAQETAPVSRQVRRQLERQSRKANKGGDRLG